MNAWGYHQQYNQLLTRPTAGRLTAFAIRLRCCTSSASIIKLQPACGSAQIQAGVDRPGYMQPLRASSRQRWQPQAVAGLHTKPTLTPQHIRRQSQQRIPSHVSNWLPFQPVNLLVNQQRTQQQPSPGLCPSALPAPLDSLAAAAAAGPLQQDQVAAAITIAVALVWVKTFDFLTSSGVLEQKLSRKLVHATAGPMLLLFWPTFSDAPEARLVAAVIPALNMVRLLAVGSGLLSDPGLVKSVSRQGDKAELLKGPLYYCLVLLAVTLLFWRENPAGAIAVSMMCGGDGFADIIGRRFGAAPNLKLPWNSAKSWPGSLAMFCAGMAMSAGFFWHFCSMGYFQCYSPVAVLPYLAVVCAACTLVESLPINTWFDDNLSVPLVATVTSLGVLPIAAAASAVIRASGQPMLAMQWLG